MQKFVRRSTLRPNQFSFSHSLGHKQPPTFATATAELASTPDAKARNRYASF
jgi:hypothetical protein